MEKTIEISKHITKVMLKFDGYRETAGDSIRSEADYETVRVGECGAAVRFEKDGAALITQLGYTYEKKDLLRYRVPGSKDELETRMTVDGERSFLKEATTVKTGESYRANLRFAIEPDEAIYGLGQQENGRYNYRGVKEYLYQNNMKIPMPVFLSSKGYAVFFDSDCLMTYEEQDNEITLSFDATDGIVYYVITGENFDALISGLRELTGAASLMPRWVFGYVQSKERYVSQANILAVADEFAKRKIPLSCLVLDWQSWEEGKWGNKILDKDRFPNLKEMTDKLHKSDVAFMISIWPNMKEGCENHKEMLDAGKLYANLSTYDAFDAKAREIYWQQMKRELVAGGADAWWCDSTEPFTPDWNGVEKRSEEERYELTKESLTTYMDARHANTYALAHAKGIYTHQRSESDKKRVVNLTRSGSPSIQGYGTILWSGDIKATWDVLKAQVAEGISMCMSGIPYWTLDIGAFFSDSVNGWRKTSGKMDDEAPWFYQGQYPDGVADKGYCELYTRWLQFGTFLPVMRSHGTDTPREPWNFEAAGEKYYDTIVKYIRMRYQLLPYSYSLGAKVAYEDYTILRSLMFDFASDPKVKEISDTFMYGNAFLVHPIVTPMEYGPGNTPVSAKKQAEVYLPAGCGWVHQESKEHFAGGVSVTVETPLDFMPVFIKEGSVIPTDSKGKSDGAADTIEVYEGSDGSFDYYLDDGVDYDYERGAYAKIRMSYSDANRELTLAVQNGNYDYPKEYAVLYYRKDGSCVRAAVSLGEKQSASVVLA